MNKLKKEYGHGHFQIETYNMSSHKKITQDWNNHVCTIYFSF